MECDPLYVKFKTIPNRYIEVEYWRSINIFESWRILPISETRTDVGKYVYKERDPPPVYLFSTYQWFEQCCLSMLAACERINNYHSSYIYIMSLLTTCHALLIFVHTFLSIDLKSLLSKEAGCRRHSKCDLRITTHYDMLFRCIRGSLIFNLRYVSLLVLALIFSTIYSDINSSLKQNKLNVLQFLDISIW
jgi:hypothetical protein